MKISENKKHEWLIIALCLCILLPLITIGFFGRPAADDYGYSLATSVAAANGNIFDVLKAAWETDMTFYQTWQGLYTSAFVLSLQPGIYGEQYYAFSSLIVILSTFLPLLWSVHIINKHCFKKSFTFSLSFSLTLYTMLLIWMPDINDGIYWFNGAMNYTPYAFTNLLNLCLLAEAYTSDKKSKQIIYIALSTVISFLTSGGNHVTAFANILLLLCAVLVLLPKKKLFCLIPLAAACAGFIIMYTAPGTAVRQAYFDSPGIVTTVVRTALYVHNICWQWMSLKWILSLVILTPVAIEFGIKNKDKFGKNFPVYIIAAVIASAAVICGMFCVPFYAMRDFGMGRVHNVIWITFNFASWFIYISVVGYLAAKNYINAAAILSVKHIQRIRLAVMGLALCLMIIIFENSLACWPVKAASELIKGIPQTYAAEMDRRFELYRDPDITEVKVDPIKNKSQLITSSDVGPNADEWPNDSISEYYGKIIVLNSDTAE